ncbi:MAG TPA: T9SS type A sorting domain-containing protein, partial [Phnomibacter sp.]|nr:T9SS type A sorting domain-containing protein [Phnomibacter sp.]
KDPASGKIPFNIRRLELAEAATIPLREELGLNAGNAYIYQGPTNIGGRCRAVAFDVRFDGTSNRVMLAGGVSGGMFRSTNGGQSWMRVSSLNDIHNVTCIAQDPRPGHQDTWYFGTGEAISNSASGISGSAFYWGHGIFKSVDNGMTWNQLPSTAAGSAFTFDNRFDFVSRIVVDPTTGDVYAATANSISLSTNGGSTWSIDRGAFEGNAGGITDVAVTPTGIVYAAIPGSGNASAGNQGVWKKQNGSWTRIAGGGDPAWFRSGTSLGRIVLGIAPSNPNLVYALYYNGINSNCNDVTAVEADMGRYDNASGTWTNLSANLPDEPGCLSGNDPFAVNRGYDLVVAVKPDNPNMVFVGGTNIYRSTDGFSTPNHTQRIGGYTSVASYAFSQASHPDIHNITFAPNNPDLLVMGSDGGVSELNLAQGGLNWVERNNQFNTLQYYHVAIDPTPGSSVYIGGAQDNGTVHRHAGNNSHQIVFSGDGVSVGISAGNQHHYVGSQNGSIYRRSPALNPGFINATLTPPNLSPSRLFVTLFHLDPVNTAVLYYADHNKLYRNAQADTVRSTTPAADRMQEMTGAAQILGNAGIRSFATSWGNYNASNSKLYFGTNDGRIYRLDDPRDCPANTVPMQINNGAGMPSGTVTSIAVNPRNADTVLAVYSNYGIVNIWFSGNATSPNPTWTAIEGNLTLPSIRSALIAAGEAGVDYYVGTSTGLYGTTQLNGNNTVWTKEGADQIGNAVVVSLKLRLADNRMLVGTHGNGLFTTDIILPVQMGSFKGMIVQGKAKLIWQTQTETNSQGFEIERSKDGRNFNRIGFVPSRGNSTVRENYEFIDPAPLERVQYYRLKQRSTNGSVRYSTVVKLTGDGMPLQLTSVVNPMSTNLIIALNDAPTRAVQISLIDGAGRTVLRQNMPGGNSNIFRANVSNLPNGIYTLWLETEGLRETRRVIKQ